MRINDVEKLREANSAAGGDGHRREYRERGCAEHWRGRNDVVARDAATRAGDCVAVWRRAIRHGKFCP